MKAKTILANATIIIIFVFIFLTGYACGLKMPVYADSTTDGWSEVTSNAQLVEAFKYYCKSRDLTIEGSVADGVTSFTTKTFNGLCNSLGIDVTALQAQIKYKTDGNLGTRFLFTATGVDIYNRIFSQFLQDNDLNVGDENVDKLVYSGIQFTDLDNYSCLVYVGHTVNSKIVLDYEGTYYRYDADALYSYYVGNGGSEPSAAYGKVVNGNTISTPTFHLKENTNTSVNLGYSQSYYNYNRSTSYWAGSSGTNHNYRGIYNGTRLNTNGFLCVYKDINSGNLSFGVLNHIYNTNNTENGWYYYNILQLSSNDLDESQKQNVNISIVSTVINNNTYEGDTIINNNGTTGDDNDPDPDDPNYNPYPDGGGTVTPPGNVGGSGSDGTINFPDFNINLPEINWSLGDLSNKFPFSIPFDMIAFLTLLNGEPQAPHITGSIPLTSHYTWNLDLDFSQFDTFAGIMRGLEFVGFMFFLISATINIVRG